MTAQEILGYGAKIHEAEKHLQETRMGAWLAVKNSASSNIFYQNVTDLTNVRVVVISVDGSIVAQAAVIADTNMGTLSFPVELSDKNNLVWTSNPLILLSPTLRKQICSDIRSLALGVIFLESGTIQ